MQTFWNKKPDRKKRNPMRIEITTSIHGWPNTYCTTPHIHVELAAMQGVFFFMSSVKRTGVKN